MKSALVALFLLAPAPTAAETLRLANGDTLTGEVLERSADRVVLAHSVLGRLELPVAEIEPPKPPNPGLLGTGLLAGWTRRAELGVRGSDGNSDEESLRGGLDLRLADDDRRWKVQARYVLERSNSETSDQNARVALARDWLRPGSPWFYFASGRYDWDRFEAWDHRVSVFGGPGYEFAKTESFDLRGRAGLGLTKEFGDEQDDLEPEGLLGLESQWRLSEVHVLEARTTFFPDFSEPSEFRNVTGADWRILLDEANGLSLKLGFENEYESDVDDDAERNDLTYYGSLVLDF